MNHAASIGDRIAQGHARFFELVKRFPAVDMAPGATPWNACEFAKWATALPDNLHGDNMRQTAAFLLGVWENRCGTLEPRWFNQEEFRVGNFDPVYAMQIWDDRQKTAFLDWCRDPFWP